MCCAYWYFYPKSIIFYCFNVLVITIFCHCSLSCSLKQLCLIMIFFPFIIVSTLILLKKGGHAQELSSLFEVACARQVICTQDLLQGDCQVRPPPFMRLGWWHSNGSTHWGCKKLRLSGVKALFLRTNGCSHYSSSLPPHIVAPAGLLRFNDQVTSGARRAQSTLL